MKKRLICTLMLAALSSPAFAAEDWTGGYVGVFGASTQADSDRNTTLGGQWSTESQALQDHFEEGMSSDLEADGTGFGLQAGYDHQFANDFVWGISAEYSDVNADEVVSTGLQPTPPFPSLSYNFSSGIELGDSWAVKTRLGFASGDSLFYLSMGWMSVDVQAASAVVSSSNYQKVGGHDGSENGFAWGLGWEHKFGDNWALQLEYQRADLGSFSYDMVYLPTSTFQTPAYLESVEHDVDLSQFRIGLNYRF